MELMSSRNLLNQQTYFRDLKCKEIFYDEMCISLLCTCVLSHSVVPDSLQPHVLWPFVHGDSPGKNTRVGYLILFEGIFPTQGSNSGLLHYRWILYQLSHQGSPRSLPMAVKMDWVVFPLCVCLCWRRKKGFWKDFHQNRNYFVLWWLN